MAKLICYLLNLQDELKLYAFNVLVLLGNYP